MELFLESVSILSRLDLLGSGFSLPSGGSRVNRVNISSAEVRLDEPESKMHDIVNLVPNFGCGAPMLAFFTSFRIKYC